MLYIPECGTGNANRPLVFVYTGTPAGSPPGVSSETWARSIGWSGVTSNSSTTPRTSWRADAVATGDATGTAPNAALDHATSVPQPVDEYCDPRSTGGVPNSIRGI